MTAVRRLYIYLVSAISLQGTVWAIIALLRNLFIADLNPPTTTLAFEIAVVIIGMPIYLVHWLWGQRLAAHQDEELEAGLRRFYLYATMAGFLGPFIANLYTLLAWWFTGHPADWEPYQLQEGSVLYHLAAIIPLAIFWWYHQHQLGSDQRQAPDSGMNATFQRIYRFGFSTAGLIMVTLGSVHLLRRLLYLIHSNSTDIRSTFYTDVGLSATNLLVGLVTWLIFWLWSQRLFNQDIAERLSVLRKFYLYAWIFSGALGAVGYATIMLASILRRLLGLPPQGDWRLPIPIIVVMGIVWAYHAYTLRQDERLVLEAPRQAGIRRIYRYLVAGIGLAALLVGLGGVISVLIRMLDQSLGSDLREQLAWFTAAVLVGLPVWLLNWRSVQNLALEPHTSGDAERKALTRKIYLYFFIFVATMTVLSGLVYIASQIFGLLLGEPAPTLSELGQAIAFSLIAVGVWLYHGASLRNDSRLSLDRHQARLSEIEAVILDSEPAGLAANLIPALQRAFPGLHITSLPPVVELEAQPQQYEYINQAGLIIAPWSAILEGYPGSTWATTLRSASATKVLLPLHLPGWEFAGVEHFETPALIQQTIHAVDQILAGEEVQPKKPLGAGALVGIIIACLAGFILLTSLIDLVISNF